MGWVTDRVHEYRRKGLKTTLPLPQPPPPLHAMDRQPSHPQGQCLALPGHQHVPTLLPPWTHLRNLISSSFFSSSLMILEVVMLTSTPSTTNRRVRFRVLLCSFEPWQGEGAQVQLGGGPQPRPRKDVAIHCPLSSSLPNKA